MSLEFLTKETSNNSGGLYEVLVLTSKSKDTQC